MDELHKLYTQLKAGSKAHGLCGADFEDDREGRQPRNDGAHFLCNAKLGHEGIHHDVSGRFEAHGPQPEPLVEHSKINLW